MKKGQFSHLIAAINFSEIRLKKKIFMDDCCGDFRLKKRKLHVLFLVVEKEEKRHNHFFHLLF